MPQCWVRVYRGGRKAAILGCDPEAPHCEALPQTSILETTITLLLEPHCEALPRCRGRKGFYQRDRQLNRATHSTGPLTQQGHSLNRATHSTRPLTRQGITCMVSDTAMIGGTERQVIDDPAGVREWQHSQPASCTGGPGAWEARAHGRHGRRGLVEMAGPLAQALGRHGDNQADLRYVAGMLWRCEHYRAEMGSFILATGFRVRLVRIAHGGHVRGGTWLGL